MNHLRSNLTIHRLLLGLGLVMLVVSMLFVHWYAMFEQHRTAVHAHICVLGSCWVVWRMLRHCDRIEWAMHLTKTFQPSRN